MNLHSWTFHKRIFKHHTELAKQTFQCFRRVGCTIQRSVKFCKFSEKMVFSMSSSTLGSIRSSMFRRDSSVAVFAKTVVGAFVTQSTAIKRPSRRDGDQFGSRVTSAMAVSWHSLQVNWPFMVNLVWREPVRRWKRPFDPREADSSISYSSRDRGVEVFSAADTDFRSAPFAGHGSRNNLAEFHRWPGEPFHLVDNA